MKNFKPFLSVVVTATVIFAQSTARADTADSIRNNYANGAAVTWDDNGTGSYPIVSAILSRPSTVTGTAGSRTYTGWSYLAQDTTASLDLFYSSTAAGPLANYPNPTVGDTILVQGVWSPFSGIAEIANGANQAINIFGPGSTGNPLYSPSPVVTSIPTINVGTNGRGVSLSGLSTSLLQLKNVTITGLGANWSGNPNVNPTGMITDQSANSMTLFVWGTSYSTCGTMIGSGAPIPTGLVDIVGFISDFYSTATSSIIPEFVPISITEVPEPVATTVCGLGSVLALICYRLRKKA